MNEKYLDREKNCGKSLAEHRKFSNISKKKSTDAIPPKTPKVYDEKFSNPIFPNKT